MNILVTGGAGYIGSNTIYYILKKYNLKANITILDNFSTGFEANIDAIKEKFKEANIEIKRVDISESLKVEEIFKNGNFDVMLHFAASIKVEESVQNPIKYYKNNVINSINLIGNCVKYKVNKIIFSSTASVYGEGREEVSEDMQPDPINAYGKSKYMVEEVLKDIAFINKDFRYVILRYFNVAGANLDANIGQRGKGATHLIRVASEVANKKRKKMYIFGNDYETRDGTCIRDYIHINDLASAHVSALKYLDTNNKSDIFNVGYGKGYTVKEVIDKYKKANNIDFEVEIAPRRDGDPSTLISKNNKILKAFDWKIEFDSLEEISKSAFLFESNLI